MVSDETFNLDEIPATLTEEEYTDAVVSVIDAISTDIQIKFAGFPEVYDAKVLTDDLVDGNDFPVSLSGEYGDQLPNIEMLWTGGNTAPVDVRRLVQDFRPKKIIRTKSPGTFQ